MRGAGVRGRRPFSDVSIVGVSIAGPSMGSGLIGLVLVALLSTTTNLLGEERSPCNATGSCFEAAVPSAAAAASVAGIPRRSPVRRPHAAAAAITVAKAPAPDEREKRAPAARTADPSASRQRDGVRQLQDGGETVAPAASDVRNGAAPGRGSGAAAKVSGGPDSGDPASDDDVAAPSVATVDAGSSGDLRGDAAEDAAALQEKESVKDDETQVAGKSRGEAGEIAELCRLLNAAADRHSVPRDFFIRLIWKESRFKAGAVSPVGALGIAQFMPGTAKLRGLADPFDREQALFASASFLADLKGQFGSWGLAAAGYNGGPNRVPPFVAGTSGLPSETVDYVYAITGRTVDYWAARAREESKPLTDAGSSSGTTDVARVDEAPRDATVTEAEASGARPGGGQPDAVRPAGAEPGAGQPGALGAEPAATVGALTEASFEHARRSSPPGLEGHGPERLGREKLRSEGPRPRRLGLEERRFEEDGPEGIKAQTADTEGLRPEATGLERFGTEATDSERFGTQATGPEGLGTEATGPEAAGPKAAEPQAVGFEGTEPQTTRERATGSQAAEFGVTRLEATGSERLEPKGLGREVTGSEAIGPEAIGLEATGLAGLEGLGPEAIGHEATGPEGLGPEATGPRAHQPDAAGPEAIGFEATGPEGFGLGATAPEDIGSEATRPERFGSEAIGHVNFGPKTTVPGATGPDTTAAEAGASKASAPEKLKPEAVEPGANVGRTLIGPTPMAVAASPSADFASANAVTMVDRAPIVSVGLELLADVPYRSGPGLPPVPIARPDYAPPAVDCVKLVVALGQSRPLTTPSGVGSGFTLWGAQVAGHPKRSIAMTQYARIKGRLPGDIASRGPVVVVRRSAARGRLPIHAMQFAAASRSEAQNLCRRIAEKRVACVVVRNS